MLTAGDALVKTLAKTLAKSQKVIFWSQKNSFRCFFFLLTAGDVLRALFFNLASYSNAGDALTSPFISFIFFIIYIYLL